MPETQNKTPDKQQSILPVINIWALAGQLGFLIVVPLLVFLLIGIRIDRSLDTTPLFIIIGLVLSFLTSTIAIARQIKRVQQEKL